MPPTLSKKEGAKSHDEMRKSQCAVCFKRDTLTEIKPQMEAMIQKVVSIDYSIGRDGLPVMICGACKTCIKYIFKVRFFSSFFQSTLVFITVFVLLTRRD